MIVLQISSFKNVKIKEEVAKLRLSKKIKNWGIFCWFVCFVYFTVQKNFSIL